MRQRLFITGIGGFIGLRLAELARDEGFAVNGLDASEEACGRATAAGFEAHRGDVADAASVRTALKSADVVVHTAAVVEEDGERALFRRVNVEGTAHVLAAAEAAGVKRFVQLSSVMVYGFDYPAGVPEDGAVVDVTAPNPYCATKVESERLVRAAHRPGRFDVVIVRPGDVYGPGSVPWILRPLRLLRAGLFALPCEAGVINPVHVDDLCRGTLLAVRTKAVGHAFNVTGDFAVGCHAFFAFHARWARRPLVTLPARVLKEAVGAIASASRLLGRRPPALPAGVDYLLRPAAYGTTKARNLLGYAPSIALDEGMGRTARALGLERHPPQRHPLQRDA